MKAELEDLSRAAWPPPWTPSRIDAVLAMLEDVAAAAPPPGLPVLADGERPEEGWHRVMADPAQFLALGVCGPAWLTRAGPVLLAAASRAPLGGAALLHYDVRSDNICFLRGRARLEPGQHRQPAHRRGVLAPQRRDRTRPATSDRCFRRPSGVGRVRRRLLRVPSRAAPHPPSPRVRQVQLQQLRTALPWAARALDLPLPA